MNVIRSRENASVKAWVRLTEDAKMRRTSRRAIIEGVHLVESLLGTGRQPTRLLVSESGALRKEVKRTIERSGVEPVFLSDLVFAQISDTKTPVGIAAEIKISDTKVDPGGSTGCLFLEGIQDAGNIGTILRSAAAFGVPDVILGPGCADPWSPKALRAGMGGHFILRIDDSADLVGDIRAFGGLSVCTVVSGGVPVDSIDLCGRVAWIFGAEGAGVSGKLESAAASRVTILMPGGAESLNVAASAAICLYEQARQISRRGVRS